AARPRFVGRVLVVHARVIRRERARVHRGQILGLRRRRLDAGSLGPRRADEEERGGRARGRRERTSAIEVQGRIPGWEFEVRATANAAAGTTALTRSARELLGAFAGFPRGR